RMAARARRHPRATERRARLVEGPRAGHDLRPHRRRGPRRGPGVAVRNADPGTEGTWTVLCGATVPVVPTALLERALEALQACSAPDKPTWAMAQRAQTLASDARAALDDPNTPEA